MPTLAQYRAQLAKDLGGFAPRATGGAVATGGDSSALIDARWPLQSTLPKTTWLDDFYLLRPAALDVGDLVRQVDQGSYDPSLGQILVDLPYANPPFALGVGEAYELHGHGFEPWFELRDLINEGLKLIMLPVQAPFAPTVVTAGNTIQNFTSGANSGAAISALRWLKQPNWVLAVEVQPATGRESWQASTTTVPTSGSFQFSYLGNTTALIPYNANGPQIQAALRLLPGLEGLTFSTGNSIQTIALLFYGGPLASGPLTVVNNTLQNAVPAAVPITLSRDIPPGTPVAVGGDLYLNGPDVLMQCDRYFESLDRLYVTALVPAYDWCRASATTAWGAQTGLSAELHEALPEVEWVSAAAQVYAWRRSPHLMEVALEQRRVRNEADAIRLLEAYQTARTAAVSRSPLLTYQPRGGPLVFPPPVQAGNEALPTMAALPANTPVPANGRQGG